MRLDMSQFDSLRPGYGVQRANLGKHTRKDFIGSQRQHPPSKARQIGIPWMSARGNAPLPREPHSLPHHIGIAGMATARNIGRGNVRQQRRVITQLPAAVAFPAIAVEVDSHRQAPPVMLTA